MLALDVGKMETTIAAIVLMLVTIVLVGIALDAARNREPAGDRPMR